MLRTYTVLLLRSVLLPASRNIIVSIVCCLIAGISLSSCNKDDDTDDYYDNSTHILLGLKVGTQLVYSDSIFTETGVEHRLDTIKILDSRVSNDTVWWKFSKPVNFTINALEYADKNNAIYSLQYKETPTGKTAVVSTEYIVPRDKKRHTYKSLYNGSMVIEKTVKRLFNTQDPRLINITAPLDYYEYTYRIPPYEVYEKRCDIFGLTYLKVSLLSENGKVIRPVLIRRPH